MKKLLLFAMGAALAMPTMAQEEDVTNLIKNAGFDEDMTFMADGSMKEITSTTTSLSDRSWAYIATDNTVYAKPKESSSQQRKDGRLKTDATNGFIGQVNGWKVESNQAFPKCEWVYFGIIPYGLGGDAVPIADDGDTYLTVPEKPADDSGDDNIGALYLRAGWGAWATYSQELMLPVAEYRLEYFVRNANLAGSQNNTGAKNLCQVSWLDIEEGKTVSVVDDDGFNSAEWVKHEITFTPISKVKIQFGFESSGGSGTNPFIWIDGIKLYKTGEADTDAIISGLEYMFSILASEASNEGFEALAGEISDYSAEFDGIITDKGEEAGLAEINDKYELYQKAVASADAYRSILSKMADLLGTNYPGKTEFQAAYNKIDGYKNNGTAEDIIGAEEEGNNAIKAYIMSQKDSATEANPADFTYFIQHPYFVNDGIDITSEAEGNLNSTGWYVAGDDGGDQNAKVCQSFPCWNAWKQGINRIAVAQDLTDLPDGYYTVSAELITQADYANGTQHVFAKSEVDQAESENLTVGNWDGDNTWGTGQWTNFTTKKVIVQGGKLTIGAEGAGNGASDQSGWFCVTNFRLYYLGEAPANALDEKFNDFKSECEMFAAGMHFAADRSEFESAINAGGDVAEAMKNLLAAYDEAKSSEAKYQEYMQEGKTLPTVESTLNGEGYGAATEIVRFAYDQTMAWINSSEATYKEVDNKVNLLKNYLNTYAPTYNSAAEMVNAATGTAKQILENLMAEQKAQLTSEMQTAEVVNQLKSDLEVAMANANKQIIWDTEGATDYTAFILNPNAEALAGWNFEMGNGDGNGEKSGQWFDGSGTRYFDTYNSAGLTDFIGWQLVNGLPNGTYDLGLYARTPAEGAYVFYAEDADAQKQFVEIPLNYYFDDEGIEQIASDKYGPMWQEAEEAFNNGSQDEQVLAIYNANAGAGRGWKRMTIEGITVANHRLLIGMACGSEALGTEKVFSGAWFSVGGWTLTLTSKGNNDGWAGPLADGIETIATDLKSADAIYTLSGVKTRSMQRGLNIIVSGGKAVKVMVK